MGLRLVSKAVRHRGTAGESVLRCKGRQSILLSGTWRGSGKHTVIHIQRLLVWMSGMILHSLSISYKVSGYTSARLT